MPNLEKGTIVDFIAASGFTYGDIAHVLLNELYAAYALALHSEKIGKGWDLPESTGRILERINKLEEWTLDGSRDKRVGL